MFNNLSTLANFHGLTGEILSFTSCRGSYVANLAHCLVFYGAGLGRYPHVSWRGNIFPALNVLLVGTSGSGKGESLGIIQDLFTFPPEYADLLAPTKNMTVTSGKNLTAMIADTMERQLDEGETRFLSIDEENSATIRCARIWNNPLGGVLIKLIDGREITDRVKGRNITIPPLHYSSVGHITPTTLRKSLKNEQFTNGLGNRFLYLGIPTPSFSTAPGDYSPQQMDELRKSVIQSLDVGGQREKIDLEGTAFDEFTEFVNSQTREEDNENLLQALQQRLPIILIRVAIILTLINQEEAITRETIREAINVIEHSQRSLEVLFGANANVPLYDTPERIIEVYLKENGCVSKTKLTTSLSSQLARPVIDETLAKLIDQKSVRMITKTQARGRRPQFFELIQTA